MFRVHGFTVRIIHCEKVEGTSSTRCGAYLRALHAQTPTSSVGIARQSQEDLCSEVEVPASYCRTQKPHERQGQTCHRITTGKRTLNPKPWAPETLEARIKVDTNS